MMDCSGLLRLVGSGNPGFFPLSRDVNTLQLVPLSTWLKRKKAGLAASFLGVAILDTARRAMR